MIYFLDRDEKVLWRYEAKALKIRDNRDISALRMKIDARNKEGELSDTDLLIYYNLPLFQYGALHCDWSQLKKLPKEGNIPKGIPWTAVTFTEDEYLDMPEEFVTVAIEAVMKKNPHRNLEFDMLKKMMDILTPSNKNDSTSSKKNGKPVKTELESDLPSTSTKKNSKVTE